MPQFDDQPKIWTGDDVFTEDNIQEVDETSTDLVIVDETPQLPSLEEQESIVNSSDLKDIKIIDYKHHGKISFPIAQ